MKYKFDWRFSLDCLAIIPILAGACGIVYVVYWLIRFVIRNDPELALIIAGVGLAVSSVWWLTNRSGNAFTWRSNGHKG